MRRTSRGLLFSVIFGYNLSSSCIKLYIVDARHKGLSIESKNTQNGLWTKKLWSSEVGGHNQKICSKEQCHPGCCTPCVLLHFGLISEPKGFGIWIYLFQGDMFSYESNLPRNFNHSIRMSDDQVMAKSKTWVLKKFGQHLP